ncbi:peptidoglycan-binding domain-containing protein [Chitinophaga eiseniae]|uniref:Peptidoglycan binding domain-containing protein n=1 Tax=Chitinophaga eiseniae TaxID=634771 RepID=A0A847SXH5_9BACT|nr:hypothetical protein [Chitinophaga eiseniae]NLR82262.1 hypothetical protein [Chitinophaga eiseniae]
MAKAKKKAAGKKIAKPQAPRGARPTGSGAGKIVITTLAVGAVGILGYLGWRYIKARQAKKNGNLDEALLKAQPGGYQQPDSALPTVNTNMETLPSLPGGFPIPDSTIKPPPVFTPKGSRTRTATGSDFPLKRGSKGDNVRSLQEALIRKYGSKILPRYGADGSFGAEMATALKKLKMPATISETFFNVLTQGSSSGASGGTDLSALPAKLYSAVLRRDFSTVLSLLANINSSTDYSTVSDGFKQYRINGVRQTLVNGLLNVFSSESQKQQLRLAFAKMGLTYDGSRWSISGLDGIPIITVVPAKIWITPTTAVHVPARMVLGQEVARKLQYVMFSNGGRHFLVHQNCIRHL